MSYKSKYNFLVRCRLWCECLCLCVWVGTCRGVSVYLSSRVHALFSRRLAVSFPDLTHVCSLMWITESLSLSCIFPSIPLFLFVFSLGMSFIDVTRIWWHPWTSLIFTFYWFSLSIHPSIPFVFLIHPFGLFQCSMWRRVCVVYVNHGFNYNSSPLT